MALTDDQRAMLLLLLERGQSYDDIAGLLGVDRPEVRRRARAALTELAGQDPDQDVALSDYLLGEADPIARADTVRQLQSDPQTLGLAQELAAKLQLIAPDAELPELPKGKGTPAAPKAGAAATESASPLSGFSKRQSRIFVALGASAVLIVAIVLAITGVFGGDDEPATSTAADTTTGETEEGTPIVLEPQQRGSDAAGLATLGFSGENDQPAMDLQLEGLEDPPEGQAYILWFLSEDDAGFPLPTPLQISKDGSFAERFALPEILLAILQTTRELDVGLVDLEQLQSNLTKAVEDGDDTLPYEGESVLRGELPRVPSGAGAGNGDSGNSGQ